MIVIHFLCPSESGSSGRQRSSKTLWKRSAGVERRSPSNADPRGSIVYSESGIFLISVISVMLIIRTTLEDRVLKEELAGFTAYADDTHYKLFPGIW
jgi:hypothetical protein